MCALRTQHIEGVIDGARQGGGGHAPPPPRRVRGRAAGWELPRTCGVHVQRLGQAPRRPCTTNYMMSITERRP